MTESQDSVESMTVGDFLGQHSVTVALPEEANLGTFAAVAAASRIGSVLIVDPEAGGAFHGMVTENHVLAKICAGSGLDLTLDEVMLPASRVSTVAADLPMTVAANRLLDDRRYLAVTVRNGESPRRAVNVIGRRDVLKWAVKVVADPSWLATPLKTLCKHGFGRFTSCPPHESVHDVLSAMLEKQIGGVLVMNSGALQGIFSMRDAISRVVLPQRPLDTQISKVTTAKVMTLEKEQTVGDAARLMLAHNFRHIPLVNTAGKVVNLVTIRMLLHALAEHYTREILCAPHGDEWPRGGGPQEDE